MKCIEDSSKVGIAEVLIDMLYWVLPLVDTSWELAIKIMLQLNYSTCSLCSPIVLNRTSINVHP